MTGLAGASVTIVGINFAPETTGIAPYTTALAEALVDGGASVRVVTGLPHYPQWDVQDARYTAAGGPWREHRGEIEILRVAHHVPRDAALAGRGRMEWDFYRRAVPAVRSSSSDAVIAVTPSLAGLAAAVRASGGRPTGVIVQDLTGAGAAETGSAGSLVAAGIGLVERELLRRCGAVGVITPRFREILEGALGPEVLLADVPNFTHITPSPLSATEARSQLGWREAPCTVVHTGNMGRKQGLEVVLEAAREAEARRLDVQFVLVGDGNQRPKLEEMASGIGSVRFVDPLDSDGYPLALAAADILLLSELPGVREMCMPSKLTSYVAAGRPVVAAVEPDGIAGQTLGRTDVAELVAAGDALGLLGAISRVTHDHDRRDHLVENARRFGTAEYSADAAAERYRAFASDLLVRR